VNKTGRTGHVDKRSRAEPGTIHTLRTIKRLAGLSGTKRKGRK